MKEHAVEQETVKVVVEGLWREALRVDPGVSIAHASFFQLGGTSLQAVALAARLEQRFGVDVTALAIQEHPTPSALSSFITERCTEALGDDAGAPERRDEALRPDLELTKALKAGGGPTFVSDPERRFEPFPLTDLQQAYVIGEAEFYESRTVAHLYQCYRAPRLDLERFRRAVQRVVDVHDILRIVIHSPDEQSVRPHTDCEPDYEDLKGLSAVAVQERVSGVAERAGAALPAIDKGPAWWVCVQETDEAWFVHVAVRLLAFDAVTLNAIYRDLAGYYENDDHSPTIGGLSFRDYVLGIKAYGRGPAAQRARRYWGGRAAELPGAPALPRARKRAAERSGSLQRLTGRLSRVRWKAFRDHAAMRGHTVNSALCRAYADTLALWSVAPSFTINMLSANRPPVDSNAARVVGNCSTTTLVAVPEGGETFSERVSKLQRRVYEDLSHGAVSGVEVIREIEKLRSGGGEPFMPVVFSSGIGLLGSDERFELTFPRKDWVLVDGRLSTPQVWLDHQVMEEGEELLYNWDFVGGHFPAGMVEEMFEHYEQHLRVLADDGEAWERPSHPLPARQRVRRDSSNRTEKVLGGGTLFELFGNTARRRPQQPAISSDDVQLTYQQLHCLSSLVKARLVAAGVRPGDVVAVFCAKSPFQVASVLGVLQAGAAYLPLDAKLPAARVAAILEHSGADVAIVDEVTGGRLEGADGVTCVNAPVRSDMANSGPADAVTVDPAQCAYVIYTSGSTGRPKGVVIDHAGAVNTILDVNERFGVGHADRILGLSSLGFDLSVYDIFGTFAAGATLILPREEASVNPAAWLAAAAEYGATVWNSVPALLEMAVEYCGSISNSPIGALRLVMLSGDWIPLPLVERLRRESPKARIVGLGGATEASIWSCFYEIEAVDPTWTSVPYGYPLANQTLHVLTQEGGECPTWVWGDLFIGGIGVMKGYLNDPEKSASSLVPGGENGAFIYRTGDRARWLPDGTVEFGGRRDAQVKVRGFRVELGEIEAALCRCVEVESAAVVLSGDRAMDQRLVGYVTPELSSSQLERIRERVGAWLPVYMIPASLFSRDALPLTPNGKVDRARLLRESTAVQVDWAPRGRPLETADERRLGRLWAEVLGLEAVNADDDFFSSGGNSLRAVRLFGQIEREFGRRLRLSSLFEARTLASQARLIAAEPEAHHVGGPVLLRGSARRARTSGHPLLVLIHPVGGDVLCYQGLSSGMPEAVDVYGIRSPAIDAGGRVPASLAALAGQYADAVEELAAGREVILAGWSMGGVLGYECAHQLVGRVDVREVFLIDSWLGRTKRVDLGLRERLQSFLTDVVGEDTDAVRAACESGESAELEQIVGALQEVGLLRGLSAVALRRLFRIYEEHMLLLEGHWLSSYRGRVTVIQAARASREAFVNLVPFMEGARTRLLEEPRVLVVDADHYSVMSGPSLSRVTAMVAESLTRSTLGSSEAVAGGLE